MTVVGIKPITTLSVTLGKAQVDRFFLLLHQKRWISATYFILSLLFSSFYPKKENWRLSVVCSVTQTIPSVLRASHSFSMREIFDPLIWHGFQVPFAIVAHWIFGDKYFSGSIKDALNLIMLSAKFKNIHSYWMKS